MEVNEQGDKFDILTPKDQDNSDKPRKMKLTTRTNCVRCGSCCIQGSPVMLKEDLSLFNSTLSYDSTYTVREGELIRSPADGELYESTLELIKIKENEGRAGCMFYREDEGCMIYEQRPTLCRQFTCWSSQDVVTGLQEKGLTRRDLFSSVELLLEIIQKHEEKCSYKRLSEALQQIQKGEEGAVDEILDMLQYDTYIRPFLSERLNIPANALDLILGTMLIETINEFGYKVIQSEHEYRLAPVDKQSDTGSNACQGNQH
ncbi:MAG: YkgJ family cysteine cluster protein [Dissulfurispiraceae bacterium]